MSGKATSIIDAVSVGVGRAASWLTLLMVGVTLAIVVMRYVFGTGLIWMQESLTWMHAAVFMLGAAYTLQADEHVRIDIFYRTMSDRYRAWVNFLGVLFFIFPLFGYLMYESFGYVSGSWTIGEISRDAGGLPYPAIPLLKSSLLLMPIALAMQGVALALRSLHTLRAG